MAKKKDYEYDSQAYDEQAYDENGALGYIPAYAQARHARTFMLEADPYDIKGYKHKRGRRVLRVITNILFIVGIFLLIIAGGMWIKQQVDYRSQDKQIEELQAYAVIDNDGSVPPEVDWASLRAINDDVVAWLQIPGTIVNYPVYQGETNDTYLHSDAYGNYSLGGLVFLDYQNKAPGMIDAQTIVYGHHLRNGAMFKPIADMDKQEMFNSVDTVWYVTEDKNWELEPLCVYYTDEDDQNVRKFSFLSDEERRAYLSDIVAKSVTKSSDAEDVCLGVEHVFTLVTCNYIEEGTLGRTVLLCVPKDEAEATRAWFAENRASL